MRLVYNARTQRFANRLCASCCCLQRAVSPTFSPLHDNAFSQCTYKCVRTAACAWKFVHEREACGNLAFELLSIISDYVKICFRPQDTTQNTPYSVSNTGYQPSLNTTNIRSQYKYLILTYLYSAENHML